MECKREYVVFLDADDWYDKESFSYMTGLLDDSKDDMAFTGMMQSINGRLSLKSKPYFLKVKNIIVLLKNCLQSFMDG
ncbi:glycosyltransferase [Lactococcus garvieae]